MRLIALLIFSSLIARPAMIVFPAPGSCASMNRILDFLSTWPYTASIWCGRGSTFETLTARMGSYVKAYRSRLASSAMNACRGSAGSCVRAAPGSGGTPIPSANSIFLGDTSMRCGIGN